MQHYVKPFVAEVLTKNGNFDCTNCANFEIVNMGTSTVLLNNTYPLKPGQAEFYPPLGFGTAYKGEVRITFKSKPDSEDKVIIKAARYDKSC